MTDHHDLPPRDIPADLVAYAMIGGPWWARLLFALRLLQFAGHLLVPWRHGAYLEIRRRLETITEMQA